MAGLVATDPVPFPLYLRTASNTWVLYRPSQTELDESHLGRLGAEGITTLFIRDQDRSSYFARVESSLDGVLHDRSLPLHNRADVLFGVATVVADELLQAPPDAESVQRAKKMIMSTGSLLVRDGQAFHAIRRLLTGGGTLARHSLTVSFLCMGLGRVVLGGDASTLAEAGLAGLLHDVGKIGHEDLVHDPEHTTRGATCLSGLGLPRGVIQAAQSHHECDDGSGFPHALVGDEIPEMARLVGLVNLFDKVYSGQDPRVGVFDALRILAQAYRGCFDDRMAQGLVKLFR